MSEHAIDEEQTVLALRVGALIAVKRDDKRDMINEDRCELILAMFQALTFNTSDAELIADCICYVLQSAFK